jgi:hypothetical protein
MFMASALTLEVLRIAGGHAVGQHAGVCRHVAIMRIAIRSIERRFRMVQTWPVLEVPSLRDGREDKRENAEEED